MDCSTYVTALSEAIPSGGRVPPARAIFGESGPGDSGLVGAPTMTINDERPSVAHSCRFCDAPVHETPVDQGMSSSYDRGSRPDQLSAMNTFGPHHSPVLQRCWLVQLEQYVNSENTSTEQSHFSPFSESWVQH
jgi:hypothetical protein